VIVSSSCGGEISDFPFEETEKGISPIHPDLLFREIPECGFHKMRID
jgi:hypothetical protein